ncbi:hypothetical protein [Nocardia camponoti]|uniref:hypothetical protein n=1 Tax=Nocardia camponoti TaxID=1616106 RepID=UPI0016686DDA|nr:hypothetical protein [Nocardia camponoti]
MTTLMERLVDITLPSMLENWHEFHPHCRIDANRKASLTELARVLARRDILRLHLYPEVTAEMLSARRTDHRVFIRNSPGSPDPERWRGGAVRSSQEAERITVMIWGPIRSLDFIVRALSLVQVRIDDGLPLPVTPLDPLAQLLTDQIHAQLIAESLPPA